VAEQPRGINLTGQDVARAERGQHHDERGHCRHNADRGPPYRDPGEPGAHRDVPRRGLVPQMIRQLRARSASPSASCSTTTRGGPNTRRPPSSGSANTTSGTAPLLTSNSSTVDYQCRSGQRPWHDRRSEAEAGMLRGGLALKLRDQTRFQTGPAATPRLDCRGVFAPSSRRAPHRVRRYWRQLASDCSSTTTPAGSAVGREHRDEPTTRTSRMEARDGHCGRRGGGRGPVTGRFER
jgi:hypothetical protein